MAKQSIFQQLAANSLSVYRDPELDDKLSISEKIINDSKILVIPDFVFRHLSKYNGFSLENCHEHLSYQDAALLLSLNYYYNYDQLAVTSFYNTLPDTYKLNIEFILKTNKHQSDVSEFMFGAFGISDDKELYKFVNINNFIYIVVSPGIGNMLRSKEYRVNFLTELSTLCFNVMGDSNTYAQPFFKELVQAL